MSDAPATASAPLSYRAALDWIYSFSDTERSGRFQRDREDNLRRERALLARLGDPQCAYGVTHIAGTKGKGSTSAMLASILRAAGVATGLYTSPDLHTFRERIQLDGREVTEEALARAVPHVRAALDGLDPALGPFITWEVATALAFWLFREAGMAHAVVEVGLGGRLDATNVVEPLATCITSISYDHMAVLGNTLAAIAGEKAGIIKPGVPLVCSAQTAEARDVIRAVAGARGAPYIQTGPAGVPGMDYSYRSRGVASSETQTFDVVTPGGVYADLELGLLGEHQLENAAAVVALAEVLRARGLPLDEAAIRRGLREARWPARMQVVRREPWVVVDSAHNGDSFARLFAALRRHFPLGRRVLVLGILADKDLAGIAREVAHGDARQVIATSFAHPRAASARAIIAALAATAPALPAIAREPEGEALALALATATRPDDLVCVAGSVAFAGAALRWLAAQPETPPGAITIAGVDHP